jgi:hypothetical protein
VDDAGCIYVAGFTRSPSPTFPIKNAWQPTLGSSQNAFVTKMIPLRPGLILSFTPLISAGALTLMPMVASPWITLAMPT